VDENKEESSELESKSLGEDWICDEINKTSKEIQKLIENYRFAEAGDLVYDLVWNRYADWFIESQKLWKNTALIKSTLEQILIIMHPFAPFVTETIWQSLSWTDGMLIEQTWPKPYKVDAKKADQFRELIDIITNIRSHFQALPGNDRYPVAFIDDQLMYDNQLLIQHLTKAPSVPQIKIEEIGGLRLAVPGHNIYLQIPEEIHAKYKAQLEENILKVGQEINTLEARLRNPKYVERAPKELVAETRSQLETKEELLAKMKDELKLV
jgi:valyl-tRNA synthetase